MENMTTDNQETIYLPLVDNPSQYLGSEVNRIRKHPNDVRIRMALAFPDLYEIGMSHFGIQILYHVLNQQPHIAAERVFAPGRDLAERLSQNRAELTTLETRSPLKTFDIIGFSLLYELNYTNMLYMMDLSGIPFYAHQRDDTHPVIIAGGPCTCNPEPVADFLDALVIGDGESVILEMCSVLDEWKKEGYGQRQKLLKAWSRIRGVYVPSFFKPKMAESGVMIPVPEDGTENTVKRAVVPDLDSADFPTAPVVPWGKPVHDRLRLEISRGCTRGCRFCQAGMIYRPVRERSMETLLQLTETAMANTGYEDLSLLSLSTGDYSCLVPLMERLMAAGDRHPTAISLPSIRANALTPALMNIIKSVRKTGFTIAPEAGSQRLRDVINKNITEADIVQAVTGAMALGWQGIKLYFMIGLPTETDADLQGIVDLVKTLLQIKTGSRRPQQITVSVAAFIPKPHTPFQWAPQVDLEGAKEKIQWLKEHLALPRVRVKWQNPEVSLLEGLWARGDRRLSELLVSAYEKGCLFDGWSDDFKFDRWLSAISAAEVNLDFYTTRHRGTDEALPWDHVDIGVKPAYLKSEYEKAMAGTATLDCRWGDCTACGVCDHKTLYPVVFDPKASKSVNIPEPKTTVPAYKKIALIFSKTGLARFLSHLELVSTVIRTLRRADIDIKYTEGFHPKPKLAFQDALPVGMESLRESMVITVAVTENSNSVMERLNPLMADGLRIFDAFDIVSKKEIQQLIPEQNLYFIRLKDGFFSQKDLNSFRSAESFTMMRQNKKGQQKTVNLKHFVTEVTLVAPNELHISLKSHDGLTLRPIKVLRHIFSLSDDQLKLAEISKQIFI